MPAGGLTYGRAAPGGPAQRRCRRFPGLAERARGAPRAGAWRAPLPAARPGVRRAPRCGDAPRTRTPRGPPRAPRRAPTCGAGRVRGPGTITLGRASRCLLPPPRRLQAAAARLRPFASLTKNPPTWRAPKRKRPAHSHPRALHPPPAPRPAAGRPAVGCEPGPRSHVGRGGPWAAARPAAGQTWLTKCPRGAGVGGK
jgi:hypothetical protein